MRRFLFWKHWLVFVFLLVSFLRLALPLWALEFPQPGGYVNDFAEIFSADFTSELEAELVALESESTIELVVVTVEDLQETTVEEFAVLLFEDWEIGKEETDNGLLILVAPNQRQIRIEVGYGLEPIITDSRAGRVIREKITPEFKKEDYEKGVQAGVTRLKSYFEEGESSQGVVETSGETDSGLSPIIVFSFIILIYLSSFWGRSKRVWPGGVVGAILGFIAGSLIGLYFWKVALPIIYALIGFFLDTLLSKNYKSLKKAKRSTNWWRSGGGFFSGGGGSSGGGSFGGFGGGSSGGGGASGSW